MLNVSQNSNMGKIKLQDKKTTLISEIETVLIRYNYPSSFSWIKFSLVIIIAVSLRLFFDFGLAELAIIGFMSGLIGLASNQVTEVIFF